MDFELSEEHLEIKTLARDFAENELRPGVSERDENQMFPERQIKQLGELGFLGMTVPEKYGGAGMDVLSYVIAMEEICRVDPSVGVIMSVNNSLVCHALKLYGTEEQKRKYLIPLASGKALGAYSLSEAGAGSDAASLASRYSEKGDCFVLNGTKMWVTSGKSSDYVIVFATKDPELRHKGISAFIIEKGYKGLQVGKKENKLGIRASDTCELIFDECEIPKKNLLGKEGNGFKIAMSLLDNGRIGIASQALGISQACFEDSVRYSMERKQFNKRIGFFQAVQQKITNIALNVEAARLLVHRAALKMDKGEKCTKEASMAKLFASESAVKAALDAIQIHGGYGYIKEFSVERYLRDAKVTEIYEGTSEVQRLVIAREFLKIN